MDAKRTVTPGEFLIDHPTLINLGFEWVIDGDANRNATVTVSYRKQGETAWKTGMPLMWLQGEKIYTVQRLYRAEDEDFRLNPGSAAIDRGVAIPNVTDGFSGTAPDLGALETGQAPPIYGPRPVR